MLVTVGIYRVYTPGLVPKYVFVFAVLQVIQHNLLSSQAIQVRQQVFSYL